MKFKVNKIDLDKKLIMEMYKKAQKKGLTEVGLKLQADASREVAVDEGRLRASIAFRVGNGKVMNNTFAAATSQAEDTMLRLVPNDTVVIGSNVEYARRIEYGWSKQCPKGYLRPAIDMNKGWIVTNLAKTFDRIMR